MSVIGFARGTTFGTPVSDPSGTNALSYTLTTSGGNDPASWGPGDWAGWGAYGAFPHPSGVPFSVADDSAVGISGSPFAGDTQGIITSATASDDAFFSATDTVNGDNAGGSFTATWTFDIAGASDLNLSADFAAMGDFESDDTFNMTYAIDGGATQTLFALRADEAIDQTYSMEGGASVTLNDPLAINGTTLTNRLESFSAAIAGTGSVLTLNFDGTTNGGSEAVVMDNIIIEGQTAGPQAAIKINEVQGSTPSTDTEFVELIGPPGGALDGLSLIVIESDQGSSRGNIDKRLDFGPGDVIGANGYFLVGTETRVQDQYGITPNATVATNFIENSSYTLALVETATLTEDNVLVAAPNVLDSIAVLDSDAEDTGLLGAPEIGPDGNFLPGALARVQAGVDTDASSDWLIQSFGLGDDETPTAGAALPTPLVINEVQGSTPSTDVEFVELFGAAGASLAGLSLIVVESDTGSSKGSIDKQFDFAADAVIGENGYFLVGTEGSFASQYGITPDATFAPNFLENSSYTLALVETASITADSVNEATPVVIDSVGVIDREDVLDTPLLNAPSVGPDGNFLPGSLARAQTGVDTDTSDDWVIQSFGLGDDETPTSGGTGGDTGGDGPTTLFIHDVQGADASSARIGENVSVQAVITAVLPGLDGFYIQEEDVDADGDGATSEGVFVYGGSDFDASTLAQTLQTGDLVTVTGTVTEFGGNTQISLTSGGGVVVDAEGQAAAVSATLVDLPASAPTTEDAAFENLEGMLVEFGDDLVVTQLFNYERFGEVHLSADDRIYQFTQTNAPDVAGNAAFQDAQQTTRIILDDGQSAQNPSTLPFLDVETFSAGDTISGLTGVLGFGDRGWAVQPTALAPITVSDTNAVQEAPEEVGGSLRVAAYNVLNYFTTLDTGGNTTATGLSPRGADSAAELQRQTDKLVAALDVMDADIVGLIEIENDAGQSAAALVDALNAQTTRVYDYVDTGVIGSDAIKVGFIYDTLTVKIAPGTSYAVLDDLDFVAPMATVLDPLDQLNDNDPKNRPALAVTFEEIASGEEFTVVNNHFKSKGSAVNGEDQNLLSGTALGTIDGVQPVIGVNDGQANGSATRESAADQLVDWLASNPTGSDDADVLILGDLNAYGQETAIGEVLEGADDLLGTGDDYTDLAAELIGEDAYSFRFSGQWGTLDYALANDPLKAQVTGITEWHVNSDLPAYLDYNDAVQDSTEQFFNAYPAALDAKFDGTSPLRSSDHDPIIVGLELQSAAPELNLVLGTDNCDRLVGTDGDDLIQVLGGRIDFATGGAGADVFDFSDSTNDGARERKIVTDFELGVDRLDLGDASIAAHVTFDNRTILTLDGDRDIIMLAGVTDFDIDLIV